MNMLKTWCASALALAVIGCTTVPNLDAGPEEVADRIASDAVAYNQAYGRAIADQVLLNVLRARDRLPLYHLSMSGITEGSQIVGTTTMGLGSINLGHDGGTPWGVGSLGQSWATTTKPSYTLNPFSSGESLNAFQFRRLDPGIFEHYWHNGWPREVLLYLMVDNATLVTTANQRERAENSGGAYSTACQPAPSSAPGITQAPPEANAAGVAAAMGAPDRCRFIRYVELLDTSARAEVSAAACVGEAANSVTGGAKSDSEGDDDPDDKAAPNCGVLIATDYGSYTLNLRSVDDMIYYLGSLLRTRTGETQNEAAMNSRVFVRPSAVYRDGDGAPYINRNAWLFRVTRANAPTSPARRHAAEVRYGGARYVAGPANPSSCDLGDECPAQLDDNDRDASARVLSLLTQLLIISQTQEAQLGPQQIIVQ